MANEVRRIFVEKKTGFDVEAKSLYNDLKTNLGISGLEGVRMVNRYDISDITDEEYLKSRDTIFSEPTVDRVFEENFEINPDERLFAVEYLPGQYDQRADSASQCIQILTEKERPQVATAKIIILSGTITDEEFLKIKNYCINPVDSREAQLEKPDTLEIEAVVPEDVQVIEGFINMSDDELKAFMDKQGFAMNFEDLKFCQEYFKETEKRNPTITEIKVIDTYWSDHCRHTTFQTIIHNVEIEDGKYTEPVKKAYKEYISSREYVYGEREKDVCLMDIAVIGMKELRKRGLLDDLDVSEEINACSIVVDADVNGKTEKWLVMFKNETHNHPTEIEPFGGAATCLGGAIRDPLSGRSYVYQAMRVTGSGDPRTSIEDTIKGKLPQRKITTGAANGYSSYGNQIGLATGQVAEIYDEGFVAKRMEVGAVIAAAPYENVVREVPEEGDVVILLGGRTGRDGCGGATGSSKEHTEESILTCGAEVQKGNAPTERKIQRLFRNKEVSRMIKRCNDFGAGGVSVAIGELSEGLDINLDLVPKKYEGLDGTELSISESQERMAVVVENKDADRFIAHAEDENLEAIIVAKVTAKGRLRMLWRGKTIVDVSRDFLDTNGVKQITDVKVSSPEKSYFEREKEVKDIKEEWFYNLEGLNVCSQKGLVEKFDSTIGAGTVIMPFGGKYQMTPAEAMAAKLPVLDGDTSTATIMSYGYNPNISKWSPFHGAVYAIVEAASKVAAAGGDYRRIRLTFQEYFGKPGENPQRWGKPFSALLGALYTQKILGIPAIGGKDSMSGTFMDMDVPPTLVAFAVSVGNAGDIISPEFKKAGNKVILVKTPRDENEMPEFDVLQKNLLKVYELIKDKKAVSVGTVRGGGIAEAVSKMAFGNMIGFKFNEEFKEDVFVPECGAFVIELEGDAEVKDLSFVELGFTQEKQAIDINGIEIDLKKALNRWQAPLEKIFPTNAEVASKDILGSLYGTRGTSKASKSFAKPRIFIPVFPGTNCEYDTARAFERAGGEANVMVLKNMTSAQIEKSIGDMVKAIKESQIIALPGGFSAGDEPDGSGKFIATIFRNPYIKEAVTELLDSRDGLMVGICNGFQALIKLGLVPYGRIMDIDENCPTLTYNKIGRHVSQMVNTRIVSTLSPWMRGVNEGDIHTIAVSHGEGRFIANEAVIKKLFENGQVATQYVDLSGNPTMDMPYNPNGSFSAIEGITSPDGRILGKMGHSERIGANVIKNVPGNKDQKIFESGVKYFK